MSPPLLDSIPHPNQELASIDLTLNPADRAPVECDKLYAQTVIFCCLVCGAVTDLPVVIGAVEQDLGEGLEGHRSRVVDSVILVGQRGDRESPRQDSINP